MIGSALDYWRREVRPRRRRILWGSHFLIAAVLGIVFSLFGPSLHTGRITYGDVAGALLAYGAISFGFAVAALSLVLAIPHDRFSKWLAASHESPRSARSSYDDLIFVFSWTAALHWMLVVTILMTVFAHGSSRQVFPALDDVGDRLSSGGLLFITVYGVCQFLIALITLAQFGKLYVSYLSAPKSIGQASPEP